MSNANSRQPTSDELLCAVSRLRDRVTEAYELQGVPPATPRRKGTPSSFAASPSREETKLC